MGGSNSTRVPLARLRDRCNMAHGHAKVCQGQGQRDSGFTLVELLIVIVILPVIVGAIAVSLLAIFKNQAAVSNRLTSSGDAQVVSASYYPDLQSSAEITTAPNSSPQCGAGQQVVGLEWQDSTGSWTVVSYSVFNEGTVNALTSWGLQRDLCTSVSATDTGQIIPTSITTLATNIPSSNVIAEVSGLSCSVATGSCVSATAAASAGWTSAVGVQSVNLTVNDVGTSGTGGWSFSLGSGPREWFPLTSCTGSPACISGWLLSGPSVLLDAKLSGSNNNKLNGICNLSVPSIGLNKSTVTVDGKNANLYNSLTSGITIYGTSNQTITTHQGTINTSYGKFSDPFAGLTQAELVSPGIPGFPTIVNLVGSTWPSQLVGGTVYIIDSSTIPGFGLPAPGANGSTSVMIWDTVNGTLSLNGNTMTDLGSNGILYAPNATLKFDGGAQLKGSNVILNNMTCDGGGNQPASLILTAHS